MYIKIKDICKKNSKKILAMKKQKFEWIDFKAPAGSIVILPREVKEIKKRGIDIFKLLKNVQKEIHSK